MVSRTELQEAQRLAAIDRYQATGMVSMVELRDGGTADSDEFCNQRNGRRVPLSSVPGLAHPNAVLAGSRFAPYGGLIRMIRARYSGPAIRLTLQPIAEGERRPRTVVTTIGPNHPVLTAEPGGDSFMAAHRLEEGQHVVYDLRHEAAAFHADFEKMPLIEDAFESVRAVSGHTTVTGAADDFHGDGQFCENEIDVVLPECYLLPVWDTEAVEQRRERDLVGANVQALPFSGYSARMAPFERVLLAASGDIGRAGVAPRHHFTIAKVVQAEPVRFDGWAFDCSTLDSLYCSDGLVVKNCTLAVIPIVRETF